MSAPHAGNRRRRIASQAVRQPVPPARRTYSPYKAHDRRIMVQSSHGTAYSLADRCLSDSSEDDSTIAVLTPSSYQGIIWGIEWWFSLDVLVGRLRAREEVRLRRASFVLSLR